MSNEHIKSGSSPTSGPGLRSWETLTRSEVMKAREELSRVLRAEFQLDLQTTRKKKLLDIDEILGEQLVLM